MQRQHLRRTVVALVLIFGIGLPCVGFAGRPLARAAQNAMPDATAPAGAQLHVVERLTNVTIVDLGATGDSIGDLLVFDNPIYDAEDTSQIGTSQGSCVRVNPGVAWECMWTVILADGQLTTEGPFLDAADAAVAITGGAGVYASAAGEMTYRARDAERTTYDFLYDFR